jgi:ABC-type transport system substrate-binding protein
MYERDLLLSVEVVQLQFGDFLDDLADRRMPMFVITWSADYPDPAAFLTTLFHSRSPDNMIDYHNPAVDDLLDRAAVEPDDEQRAELLRQAHQLILDDAVVMPLIYGVDYLLVADHVQGLENTPLGIREFESVWISAD